MLGVSVSTVKTQCARALDKLRTLVPDLRMLADVHEAGR
jgi:DNA-directed RNA polymerase specialized sigma24 family protein